MARLHDFGKHTPTSRLTVPYSCRTTIKEFARLLHELEIEDEGEKIEGKKFSREEKPNRIIKVAELWLKNKTLFIDREPESGTKSLSLLGSVPASFDENPANYDESINLNDAVTDENSNLYNTTIILDVDKENGDSMTGAGIFPKDRLIVELTPEATHNDIVIAFLIRDGVETTPTVKRYVINQYNESYLIANSLNSDINNEIYKEFRIWGVVRYLMHNMKNRY